MHLILIILVGIRSCAAAGPLVISTWKFPEAMKEAWNALECGCNSVDAVEVGCVYCELKDCKPTVGYGGSPDESGETTLDAMIFDGKTMDMGAVADLRRVKCAVSVAKYVMRYTKHSILAGDQATSFAIAMGFKSENLTTDASARMWKQWKSSNCQPNFWRDVTPDPEKDCGPYSPNRDSNSTQDNNNCKMDPISHNTIAMIAIDKAGDVAAGTTTNGLIHKIAGRVSDSSVPGAGAYAENSVGGACATGNGDIMMRFLPTFVAVQEMKLGKTPQEAAQEAVQRILKYYPDFAGAVMAVNQDGQHGAACNYMDQFTYLITDSHHEGQLVCTVDCMNKAPKHADKPEKRERNRIAY